MTPVSSKIVFETKVGNVELFTIDGGWVFEFVSGWNNGLHCDVPFPTFDKCYGHIKSRMSEWKRDQKEG